MKHHTMSNPAGQSRLNHHQGNIIYKGLNIKKEENQEAKLKHPIKYQKSRRNSFKSSKCWQGDSQTTQDMGRKCQY